MNFRNFMVQSPFLIIVSGTENHSLGVTVLHHISYCMGFSNVLKMDYVYFERRQNVFLTTGSRNLGMGMWCKLVGRRVVAKNWPVLLYYVTKNS